MTEGERERRKRKGEKEGDRGKRRERERQEEREKFRNLTIHPGVNPVYRSLERIREFIAISISSFIHPLLPVSLGAYTP